MMNLSKALFYNLGRILIVIAVAAIVALVTNLGHRMIECELQEGTGLVVLLLGTTLLNIMYAVGISNVYRWIFIKGEHYPAVQKYLLYLLGAMLPPIVLNLLLLQILVFEDVGLIYHSVYWITDFPFFFVPLLLYVLAVLYWPRARLLAKESRQDREQRAANFLNSWLNSRKMLFLMSYLDMVYGAAVVYSGNKVRIKDILMISFEEGVYFFILRDGTKVATSLNSVDIDKWLLRNWFFKASRWTYVNMLYVQVPEVSDKVLKLTHSVNENIRDKSIYAKISSGLNVNRKQQHKLGAFLHSRKSLSHEGWDEMIEL